MLSRTADGVVVAIRGSHHTILLKGTKIVVAIPNSTFRLGSQCSIAFDLTTNKIARVINPVEWSADASVPIPETQADVTPEEMSAFEDLELECSRVQSFEDLELEDEYEYGEWSVLEQQSFEG